MVLFTHHPAVLLAYRLGVHTLVVAGGETIVNPQERTELATREGFLQHLYAVSTKADDFARTDVAHFHVVEVGEGCRLACYGIGSRFLADDDGCAPQEVARGNDAVFGQHEHRARALDALIDVVDAIDKGLAHVDEQRHQLGLVDLVGALLAEVDALLQQLRGYLGHVVDFCHRDNGIAT